MSIFIEEKPSFSIIGKLGQGPSNEGSKWIPALWEEANQNFNDIRKLAKTDEAGNIAGIWGAMSDITGSFQRWGEHGKYLAGCEVVDNSIVPTGWTKWVIPSFKYAVIKCNQNTYHEKLGYMINKFIPNNDYIIVGAIHEYYDPTETKGDLYLYFPIEKT